MKTAVLYGSTRGTVRRLVGTLGNFFHFSYDLFDVKNLQDTSILQAYDLLIFITPTYGDCEPQEDIEDFTLRLNAPLSGRYFAIMVLGTYEGYDFLFPDGGRILREELRARGLKEAIGLGCVDAMPGYNEKVAAQWCRDLDAWYHQQQEKSAKHG